MTRLDEWLRQATRCLSADSAACVRREIHEHYESAREAAVERGISSDEAERLAIVDLGDPKEASARYRRVLLTSTEARLLRATNSEARAFHSRKALRWLLLAFPLAALSGALVLSVRGETLTAQILLVGGITMGLLRLAPLLPLYTPARSRLFRVAKWMLILATISFAFGPDVIRHSWLLSSCLWPLIWTEATRVAIRRKLPVANWPKQLYL